MYYVFRFLIFCIFSYPVIKKDIVEMKIPIIYSHGGLMILLIYELIESRENFLSGIFGLVSLLLIFTSVKFLCKGKLGEGDIHYCLFCGFFCGFVSCHVSMIISCISAIAFIKGKKIISKIPFAPFMFSGAFVGRLLYDVLNFPFIIR